MPFSRQVMTLSPYSHRRFAVARLMPNSQQIGFQAVRFARNQTSLASCGSSQRNHSNAASASVMARGPGRGRRVSGCKIADDAKAERVFLSNLDEFANQGRTVKSARALGYAPKAFAASGRTEGVSKEALDAAMERLFAKGEIVEVYGGHRSPSKQTLRIVRAKVIGGSEPMLNPLPNPMLNPLLNPC